MKDIRFTEKKVDQSWKDTINKQNNDNASIQSSKNNETKSTDVRPKENGVHSTNDHIKETAINDQQQQPGAINFTSFVSSLAMQALIHIGEIPNPMSKKNEINLAAASELIDILSMIEDKTKGNLTKDEDKMMKAILYDIRIRYVEKTKEDSAP